ncbi:MAG: FAD-dependent oxidoreductase [Candidatus Eisenbacteria bacterium]
MIRTHTHIHTHDREADVLVLGAGLQGCGIALELAGRGVSTTLIEQDAMPLNRASLRNEGKIHLGIIYANDRTMATAQLQLEGALRFRSILTRWMQGDRAWLSLSTPFRYLVAEDSVLAPESLGRHYEAVSERCRVLLQEHPELDYLGERPTHLARPLSSERLATHFDPARFIAGFQTVERAIDTGVMAAAMREAVLGRAAITFLPSHRVRAISEQDGHIRVEGDGAQGPWRVRARQVVNAMWEQRLRFDQQMGIPPSGDLLYRLKYRVIARLPDRLRGAPSVTMVLGPYGDVVVRPDGTAYLSWYPSGLRGWTHDIHPPSEWEAACRGEVHAPLAREIAHEVLRAIDAWYPGIGECEPLLVDAGAIVAIGRSDVDDAASALHDRSHVGVTSQGGYHSVDPGKLTTAPMFALLAADRVEEVRRATSRTG